MTQMATVFAEIEEKTIRAFIQKERQERCCFLLAHQSAGRISPKNYLIFKWLDDSAPGRSAAV